MRVTEFFSVAFCSSVLDLLPCSLCSLKDILSSHFTTSRSEPAPVNHGDAAPIVMDGIVPASFLLRGACLLKKKIGRFLFVCLFCLGAVLKYHRCLRPWLSSCPLARTLQPSPLFATARFPGGAFLGFCRALSPGPSGRCCSLQLINFHAAPSLAIVVPSRTDSPAVTTLRD